MKSETSVGQEWTVEISEGKWNLYDSDSNYIVSVESEGDALDIITAVKKACGWPTLETVPPELSPCPFCGSPAQIQELPGLNEGDPCLYIVSCTSFPPYKCPVGNRYLQDSREAAAISWNMRMNVNTALSSIREERDALKAQIATEGAETWYHTCTHHTDREREPQRLHCPICVKKTIGSLREEKKGLQADLDDIAKVAAGRLTLNESLREENEKLKGALKKILSAAGYGENAREDQVGLGRIIEVCEECLTKPEDAEHERLLSEHVIEAINDLRPLFKKDSPAALSGLKEANTDHVEEIK